MRHQKNTRLSLSSGKTRSILNRIATQMLQAKTKADKAAVVESLAVHGIAYAFPPSASRPLPAPVHAALAASEEKD